MITNKCIIIDSTKINPKNIKNPNYTDDIVSLSIPTEYLVPFEDIINRPFDKPVPYYYNILPIRTNKLDRSPLLKILDVKNAMDAKNKLISLMDEIGLERSLRKLGISEDGLQVIVNNGFNPQRVVNNPAVITQETVWKILKKIL